jgi:hypothetical protein
MHSQSHIYRKFSVRNDLRVVTKWQNRKMRQRQIVKLRIKQNEYPKALVVKCPGYAQVKNKLYNYYNNLDSIKKDKLR